MTALPAFVVRSPLEGPLCEEGPGCLAKRKMPRPVSEATAGVSCEVQALQRWYRGASLLRPPYAAVPAADAVAGRDDRALYQPYPGEALLNGALPRFLSSRKRGELLPKVYEALQMEARKKPEQPDFAALMKEFLRTDPYKCILCGNRLRFSGVEAGRHIPELMVERLHGIERKRWLLT